MMHDKISQVGSLDLVQHLHTSSAMANDTIRKLTLFQEYMCIYVDVKVWCLKGAGKYLKGAGKVPNLLLDFGLLYYFI